MLYRRLRALFISAIACICISGCGYSLHRKAELPFTSIQIGSIINKTLEPRLQDKLQRALAEEFAKNGIDVTPYAKNSISGEIRNFEMTSLSEKKDITVEYRIIMEADFTYTDSDGSRREIRKVSSPFIVLFTASRDMALLLGSRDIAEDKAAADIAMEIVGALIYK